MSTKYNIYLSKKEFKLISDLINKETDTTYIEKDEKVFLEDVKYKIDLLHKLSLNNLIKIEIEPTTK